MKTQDNQEFAMVRIKKVDYKKLCDYKVHPNQPIHEVIKNLLKGEQEGLKQAPSAPDLDEEMQAYERAEMKEVNAMHEEQKQ